MLSEPFIYVENFVPRGLSNKLLSIVTDDSNFPWFYKDTIVDNANDLYGFSHVLYADNTINSNFYSDFDPLLYFCEEKFNISHSNLIRMRVRMTTAIKQKAYTNDAHTDYTFPHYVLLYYVNDSDGDTILYDKFRGEDHNNLNEIARISPKSGAAVIFDGLRYHSGAMPSSNRRIVVNTNFN
jgi:hypothetical protein